MQMQEEIVREGYAWIGVGAQSVGINAPATGLKAWDAVRYASLAHPGDAYSYDIFSQAARAIRQPRGEDPLRGLRIRHVLATGRSQSAFRLVTYINAIHPAARLFDGYFVHSRGSNAAGISADGLARDTSDPIPAGARIRSDLDGTGLRSADRRRHGRAAVAPDAPGPGSALSQMGACRGGAC